MRWDKVGTTTGPTQIGGVIIPEGAELFVPIAEPADMGECPSCRLTVQHLTYPTDEAKRFLLHLERHLVPTVRYKERE